MVHGGYTGDVQKWANHLRENVVDRDNVYNVDRNFWIEAALLWAMHNIKGDKYLPRNEAQEQECVRNGHNNSVETYQTRSPDRTAPFKSH